MTIFSNRMGIEKLKKVLVNDKHINPNMINEVLKSDIFNLLLNYMDITEADIITKIELDEKGNYVFRCKAKSKRLKTIGILP